jgi:pyruvate,orthophosphate dikinase
VAWAAPRSPGASELSIDLGSREVHVGDTVLREGERIAIDGTTGRITTEDVPLIAPAVSEHFQRILGGPTSLRRSACARTPTRPRTREGARVRRRGHRAVPHRAHVLRRGPPPEDGRRDPGRHREERREALSALAPLQQEDFEGIFEAMEGQPVTIRLLDPPLHEFLPHRAQVEQELEVARIERSGEVDRLERLLDRVGQYEEANPMLARAASGSVCCSPTCTRCRPRRSSGPRSPCASAPGRCRRSR